MSGNDAALRAFERACAEFEVPETRRHAEAVLLDFRKQQNPISACQHILEHSHNVQACFQAVLTLREAALRNWGVMGREAQVALRSYILHYTLRHAEDPGLVRAQLTGALVALLKRGWQECSSAEQHAFFAELEKAVCGSGAAPVRKAALQILAAVVTEFSPATASALGQSWDFHEQCRASLEKEFLRSFFVHAVTVAREAAPAAAPGSDGGVCGACIQLLIAILSWDFRYPQGPPVVYGSGRPSSDSLQVKPGPEWRELLLAPEAVEWLLALLHLLRGNFSPLASDARNLLVMLISVSGPGMFPTPVAAQRAQLGLGAEEDAQTVYLRRLLGPVLAWISPPQAALHTADSQDEAELLDACRAIAAAAAVHGATGFELAVPPGAEGAPPGGVLGAVGALTQGCIAAGGTTEQAEGTWLGEASEMLLDAWVALLSQDIMGTPTDRGRGAASGTAAEAAGGIFRSLTEAALREFAAGAYEDEAEGEAADAGTSGDAGRDAGLARSAALGRAAAEPAMLLITSLVNERLQKLHQVATSGSDPSVPLEELCWLLRMGAHLIADSGEGETPLPPLPITAAEHVASTSGRADPAEALSHALLGAVGICLDKTAVRVASPRLMEAAVWAAARWADTYLLQVDACSPAMGAAFGPQGGGPQVLSVLASVGNLLLGDAQWAGEVDLHRVVITKLLAALVRRRIVCMQLVHLEAWQALAGAFAAQTAGVQRLAGPLQRTLAQLLCQAAKGLGGTDGAEVASYVSHLFHNVAGEVRALSERPDLPDIADRPDVALRLDGLLNILRGSASGCTARSQPPLWALVRAMMVPLIIIAEAEDAGVLCDWVLQSLQRYRTHKQGQVSVAVCSRLREDAAKETYRDLRALLRLLTHLTQRDLLEFSSREASENGSSVDVAKVVFTGLGILVPLMQDEQLKFPKLARAYFTLLSYMLEVYPERVTSLPESQIRQVLGTLQWGVQANDLDMAQPSLEALAALARFHATALAAGAQGVGPLPGDPKGALEGFLEVVVLRLLLEQDWRDLVDAAADCLLPLILAHQPAFQQFGEQLVASQAAHEQQEVVSRALGQLLGSNGVTANLDRANRRRFRSNLASFVAVVRDIVRTR